VLQMTVGICLSLLNHLEYKDYKKVWFQWVPEIVFFEGIFGYLVLCIFYKWAYDWDATTIRSTGPDTDPHVAPNLLNMLINMFMSPGSDISEPLYARECYVSCEKAVLDVGAAGGVCLNTVITEACPILCWETSGSPGEQPNGRDRLEAGAPEACFSSTQTAVQLYLLIAAFIAVPCLLLPIPFIEINHHAKAKKGEHTKLLDSDAAKSDEHVDETAGHDDDHEEFSAGDAFIHQGIHTIEFVLGAISNTASYLRLWALSLAHSQLAELFKDMVFGTGLNPPPGAVFASDPKTMSASVSHVIMLFITFCAWLVMSFVVLMVMENLSSFLHALRLQWVEFQSKFFYGDGYRFAPLSFKSIGEDMEEEE